MQQIPDVSFLSDEEKLWFAKAIAGMVVADGRVDNTEVEFVKAAIGFLTRREDVATIMSIIKQNQIPPPGFSKIESKASFMMLKFLAEIMVVDHKLTESEVLFFNQVGKLLGFTTTILERLWKTARQQLEKNLPRGVVDIIEGEGHYKITLLNMTGKHFSFRLHKAVTPNCRIILHVGKSDGSLWDPVQCRMAQQHVEKIEAETYLISATYEQPIAEIHGIPQILEPEKYAPKEDTTLHPRLNSLHGRYVKCFVCGTEKIPFYRLRTRSMIAKPNIFGMITYLKSAGNLDFCNFNLLDVKVCPGCGFASKDYGHFHVNFDDQPPFDIERFKSGWDQKIQPLLQELQPEKESCLSENRPIGIAILANDMGVATLTKLVESAIDPEKKYALLRETTSVHMVQAEFYMEENQQDKAESELRAAQKIANAIFEHLAGVPSLHVALLLFQIAIYFKELKDAGQIMRFTDNYNKDGRLAQGSDEYKAYVVTKNTVKNTYDDRELIDREKMTSFFLE